MLDSHSTTLLAALANPAVYPHPVDAVERLETHISWIFLAGEYAYKVKKPVNFGFLDFSDLDKRRLYCQEELRLNRRLAATLYLDVVAIGGSFNAPVFGAEPALEYAVRMRRFPLDMTFDQLLPNNRLQPQLLDQLAVSLADFHAGLSAADDDRYGQPECIIGPVRDNFRQLASLLPADDANDLTSLQQLSITEFEHCRALMQHRRQLGMIRECHGDLHLGNIVLLDGVPTPFDGIEFSTDLRWIDVISDIGFLLMDLLHKGRSDLAYRFLNAYLQCSGDYAGLGVLRFYLAYRAMVRGKVTALFADQQEASFAQTKSYLELTMRVLTDHRPALIITHGLPGCGKTALSQILLERFAAIRLRSDVERKRLFGLRDSDDSRVHGIDIFTPQATDQTYRHLLAQSRSILNCGLPLIVDAAFLRQAERSAFRELACELAVPFIIVSIQVDDAVARLRLLERQHDTQDASEAGVEVYQFLQTASEPLSDDECGCTLQVTNNGSLQQLSNDRLFWRKLKRRLVGFVGG